ncbi:zinc ion binding [Puccinia graminis f. sp. tritici]|uniref:Zinc ion binding n=1 Tax=Puccinia graminis f. sp. tritici TaxID=56615 RepID=A0A5B0S7E7_PUCGR|nr:zinc ion binding [Puccinia graminis f. sp. tritici]
MDEEMLQRTEEALSHLNPQDRRLFERHLSSLQAAHDQLAAHPDRDRLDEDENRRYFADRDEIESALGRLPEAITQRLRHVLGLWEVLIFFLEESRACSFGIRRRLAQQLSQFTLSDTAVATLTKSHDGDALECAICNEELSLPDQSIVQLPCHASHIFHRECILV